MRDDDIDDTVIRRPGAPRVDSSVDDALGDTVIRPVTGGHPDGSAAEDTIVRVPTRPGAGGGTHDGVAPRLPSAPDLPAPPTALRTRPLWHWPCRSGLGLTMPSRFD